MSQQTSCRARQSVLFVNVLAPEEIGEAVKSGADVVCLDLEDPVPPERKAEARAAVPTILRQTQFPETVQLALRINSLRSLAGVCDLLASLELVQAGLGAIVLPMIENADEVRWAGCLADEASVSLDFYGIIETLDGLQNCREIAKSHSRLKALFFGAFDLSAALRSSMEWDSMLYARSRVVHAAASAGIEALDSPFPSLNDVDGLRVAAQRVKSLGMTGKAAKHPSQIASIKEIFNLRPADLARARARAILALFDANPADPLVYEGKLIERPAIDRLRQLAGVVAEC